MLRIQQYTLSISRKHSIILLCWRGKNREQRSFIPYISFVGFVVIFFSVWPWGAGNSCQVVGRTRRNPAASSRGWMEREIGDAGKKYADKIYVYTYIHGPKVQGGRRRRCLPQRGFAFEGRNHPAKLPWFLEINSPPPPPHIMSPGIIRKTDRD